MKSIKLFKQTILLALVLLSTSVSFSQIKKEEKAGKDFNKYDFMESRRVFEEMLSEDFSTGNAQMYKSLGDTYYYNGQYAKAAKSYLTLIKLFPDEATPNYYFRAAQSLKSQKKYDEADKIMDDFLARGGNGIVGQNFEQNRAYLESIELQKKDYILENVSVNSATASDFGPAYYMDKIVYASAATTVEDPKIHSWTGQPFLNLFVAEKDADGVLSEATELGGNINTDYHESTPVFTKDGKTAYFTRNNFLDGKKSSDKDKTIGLKIYKAIKSGDNYWTVVGALPTAKVKGDLSAINSDEWNTAHPALSVDESRLYFSSDRPGSIHRREDQDKPENKRPKPKSDLWYVDIKPDTESGYGTPINLGPTINTEERETMPFISAQNTLFFATDGRMGLGGLDVYETKLDENGMIGDIVNLGEPVNSNQDDFGFIWNDDDEYGYLTTNRDGQDGSKSDEIYRVVGQCKIIVAGIVTDKVTGLPLPKAKVTILDINSTVLNTTIAGEDGTFKFEGVAECDSQYLVRGEKENYLTNEKLIDTPSKSGEVYVPIPLQPSTVLEELCVIIYFTFDRYVIREDEWNLRELNKITTAMQLYPDLRIKIESHTDSRGSDEYNRVLSHRRAEHTKAWIVENTKNSDKPILANRLVAEGFGEKQLLDRCDTFDDCGRKTGRSENCEQDKLNNPLCSNGVNCSKEEHQLNRRSKFIEIPGSK